MIRALDHVQLAMPEGGEHRAVGFYAGVLGLAQVAKPQALAGRGGVWFERGAVRIHLGVETPFFPARKAHPAFEVDDLSAARAALVAGGHPWQRDDDLPGLRRGFTYDPFGNRIELLERL
ncbi:MAG TPA: glyoxalase [Rhodobacterales bacterium]|nr:glyoxalase [Rhodobacterales bacterium]